MKDTSAPVEECSGGEIVAFVVLQVLVGTTFFLVGFAVNLFLRLLTAWNGGRVIVVAIFFGAGVVLGRTLIKVAGEGMSNPSVKFSSKSRFTLSFLRVCSGCGAAAWGAYIMARNGSSFSWFSIPSYITAFLFIFGVYIAPVMVKASYNASQYACRSAELRKMRSNQKSQ